MSGHSDDQKDYEQRVWVEKWVPDEDIEGQPLTVENLRFQMARARSAQAELARLNHVLSEFKRVLR